jgi:AcrR family transcriptional regulator
MTPVNADQRKFSMSQSEQIASRTRGRPQCRPDDVTRQLIIQAAADEFLANGYAATSMGTVAQRAGVSTKTLYRLIPTKAELFKGFVAERIELFMMALDAATLETLDIATALERILTEYGKLTLTAQTIAINRLAISESDRFPELATAFYMHAPRPIHIAIEGWLRRQCERGVIELEDPSMASGFLRGMMILDPQREVMLGQRQPPDEEEITARARACARIFLRGCLRKGV